MNTLFNPILVDLVKCAEREVAYRKRVYARLVSMGKMTQAKADWEIACMQAIVEKLSKLS